MTPQDAHKIATELHMKNYDACKSDLYNIISYACNEGLYSIKKYNDESFFNFNRKTFEFHYNSVVVRQVLEDLLEEGWSISINIGDTDKIGFILEW